MTTDDQPAWEGDRVARWLRQADALDQQFAPVTARLLEAAALAPGETVLDVGCGTGPTTRAAAVAVGAHGRVCGLDVSPDMLAAAAAYPVEEGAAPITWTPTDVAAWEPGDEVAPADVVISRFGVMFFADPVTAMRRLAGATRAGGRLAVAVWARRDASPQFEVPYAVARRVCALRGHPVEDVPVDRGPFSWHDATDVRHLLEEAGWTAVRTTPHRLALRFGGGVPPAAAAEAALDFGPTRALLEAADDATRSAVRDEIARVLLDHLDASGRVVLDAELRVVTARRGE